MKRSLLTWYVVAGALLGGAFLHQLLWPLFVAGLVCWCFALAQKQDFKSAFYGGWIAGTIKMMLVLWWFWSTYPLEWMNIHPALVAGVLIGLYWFLTAAVIGLGFAASTFAAHWFLKKYSRTGVRVLLLPLAIVGGEVLGSLLFSIYILGEYSSINAYFSFGYLGYLLVDHGVLRYAGLVGTVYALSYVAGVVGVSLHACWPKQKKKKIKYFLPVGVFVLVFLISGFAHIPAGESQPKKIRVATVHSEFKLEYNPSPQSLMLQKRELMQAIDRALAYNPAYIILPEASNLSYGSTTDEVSKWFASKSNSSVLIDSTEVSQGDKLAALRSYIYDPAVQTYSLDKKYLAPQGEFVPYFYKGLFTLFGAGSFFESRTGSIAYKPAKEFGKTNLPPNIPAVMFCSENLPPFSVFAMRQKRDFDFVAHPVSDSWFNSPYVLWNENRQMVALQALFNGVPVLQAGNMAESIGYDARGRVMKPDDMQHTEHTLVSIYEL